jgi:hypothetical protein
MRRGRPAAFWLAVGGVALIAGSAGHRHSPRLPHPEERMTAPAQMRYLQGIAVPASSVRPEEFFARTRRKITAEKTPTPYAGAGRADYVPIKKSDILGELLVTLRGTITVTVPAGGSVNSTARWPYDFLKSCQFQANGQSNLVSCSGAKLKVRDLLKKADLTDRGVSQTVAGAARSNGTLSQASEAWGVGQSTNAIAAGSYDYDVQWVVPVAEDMVDLPGAIFCSTSSTDLALNLQWANVNDVFTVAGGATVTVDGTLSVTATKFSIPIGTDGQLVVPDLSLFHSLIESRDVAIANGDNEVRLAGQGVGRSVLRLIQQVWTGAGAAAAPLAVNRTNFGRMAWRYGGNETPDEYLDGSHLRKINERQANADVGLAGFAVHEFASENAFRDIVDLGTTSELRLAFNIPSGVALAQPAVEYVQESVFRAGAGE